MAGQLDCPEISDGNRNFSPTGSLFFFLSKSCRRRQSFAKRQQAQRPPEHSLTAWRLRAGDLDKNKMELTYRGVVRIMNSVQFENKKFI